MFSAHFINRMSILYKISTNLGTIYKHAGGKAPGMAVSPDLAPTGTEP